MAISLDPRGRVVITPTYTTIGYEDIHCRITSLLHMMSATTEANRLSVEDIYYVCTMIEDLLPSIDDFVRLEAATKTK